jgi:putative ABC transport system permease protein
MLRNYLIVAVRSLLRHRMQTAINVAGLALGLAFCTLAWRYASTEWSYDRFHTRAQRIYRVYLQGLGPNGDLERMPDITPVALGPFLQEISPDVVRTTRLVSARGTGSGEQYVRVVHGSQGSDETFLLTDPAFLEMFTFPLERGDPLAALSERNSVILSHELAQRLFGESDPLGARLSISSIAHDATEDFLVTGVAARIPQESSIRFNLLLPYRNAEFLFGWEPDAWEHTCNTYVMLRPGVAAAGLAAELGPQVAHRLFGGRAPASADLWGLQRLTDLHSDTRMSRWIGHGAAPPTSPVVSLVLAAIALSVLLMGCMNFVNLAVARAVTRAPEVAVRKAIGSNPWQLRQQFLGEALVLTVLALVAGLALAQAALPAFNAYAGRDLSLELTRLMTVAVLLALVILVSVGAGMYPALVLSRLSPLHTMHSRVTAGATAGVTRWLVGFQLALSIGFTTCAVTMSRQLSYLQDGQLGFDQERVVVVDTDPLHEMNPSHPLLMESFKRQSRISHVSSTRYDYIKDEVWGSHGECSARAVDGREVDVQQCFVDHDFVQTMGIELVAGRDFSHEQNDAGGAIITETLAQRLGWSEPVGQELGFDKKATRLLRTADGKVRVIGVVRDFSLRSRQRSAPPVVLLLNPSLGPGLYEAKVVLVRVLPGEYEEVVQYMQETWSRIVPYADFRFSFLQQDIEHHYREERRWQNLITWASVCAITIGILGALALTSLATARRTREIGIRKVVGATSAKIIVLLSRDFIWLGLVASAVACPVAYLACERWLQTFARRMPLGPYPFVLSALLVVGATLVVVSAQALRASRLNPVDAVRDE